MNHPKHSHSLMFRLRKTKAAFLAVAFTLAGIVLIMIKAWLEPIKLGDFGWIRAIPFGELGGTLIGAGFLGTMFEYTFRKDQQQATTDQFRQIITEQAPVMRDAVIDGFAIHPDDLKRVATPQLLDQIASNAMGLRLGDAEFAREIYADLRDQTINAAERWYDVDVRIRLSAIAERNTDGVPLFDVLVEWEYTTIPAGPIRRFACVSTREEYEELRHEIPVTSTWLMTPRPGMDAASKDCYQLCEFTINGVPQAIRRSSRKTGQTYTVTMKDLPKGPVRIKQTLTIATPAYGHRLYFRLNQPSKGLSLRVDYTDTPISRMHVTDTVASCHRTIITRNPDHTAGKTISLENHGWLLPKAGYAFTWTLNTEMPHDQQS